MVNSERRVLTTPRWRLVLGLIVFVAAAGLGLWFTDNTRPGFVRAWSWLGVALLAVGALVAAFQLKRPPQLILTAQGFRYAGPFSPGLIAWADIEAFLVYEEEAVVDLEGERHGGVAPHAAWRLKPGSERTADLVSRLNRSGGLPIDGSLPRNIGMGPDALVELMEDWRVRYG